MTWEQKLEAIKAVAGYGKVSLNMRGPGSWYVTSGINRKEGGVLSGGLQDGSTPQQAVEQAWEWATDPRYYLIVFWDGIRLARKWNGFMWEEVDEANYV